MIHGRASSFKGLLILLLQVCSYLKHFLSCSKHEEYSRRFLSSFCSALSTHPYFCWAFCGDFWKAHKNISVFKNDPLLLFETISHSNLFLIYASLRLEVMGAEKNRAHVFLAHPVLSCTHYFQATATQSNLHCHAQRT